MHTTVDRRRHKVAHLILLLLRMEIMHMEDILRVRIVMHRILLRMERTSIHQEVLHHRPMEVPLQCLRRAADEFPHPPHRQIQGPPIDPLGLLHLPTIMTTRTIVLAANRLEDHNNTVEMNLPKLPSQPYNLILLMESFPIK
jgi:hypothetical protein